MAAATSRPDILFRADRGELEDLREFARRLDETTEWGGGGVRLVGATGNEVVVPSAALRALKLVAKGMSAGLALSLLPYGKELTTQEAADLLHVSRPHLVKLLEEGRIPHHRVGTLRRVRLEDVVAFAAERTERRREEVRELTRLSQEAEGATSSALGAWAECSRPCCSRPLWWDHNGQRKSWLRCPGQRESPGLG
jgi:excisionase family DNA binding protein